jgi:hypothetical protein
MADVLSFRNISEPTHFKTVYGGKIFYKLRKLPLPARRLNYSINRKRNI